MEKVCRNKQCVHGGKPQSLDNFYAVAGDRTRKQSQCKDCVKTKKGYNRSKFKDTWMNMWIG